MDLQLFSTSPVPGFPGPRGLGALISVAPFAGKRKGNLTWHGAAQLLSPCEVSPILQERKLRLRKDTPSCSGLLGSRGGAGCGRAGCCGCPQGVCATYQRRHQKRALPVDRKWNICTGCSGTGCESWPAAACGGHTFSLLAPLRLPVSGWGGGAGQESICIGWAAAGLASPGGAVRVWLWGCQKRKGPASGLLGGGQVQKTVLSAFPPIGA